MSTDIWELKEQQTRTEAIDQIDYKMVSFSLGGKDYGIDIMKVKEILKVNKFTYVPNSEPYVRGVYNLRGDIISIIDLRTMFRVEKEDKGDGFEDIIVLTIDDKRIGVIVDSINKVVGVQSSSIQQPHPIFSNINIKYIRGIVEKDTKIYIILDVDRILGEEEELEETGETEDREAGEEVAARAEETHYRSEEKETDINKDFIKETLKTFIGFNVTEINNDWFQKRFSEWKKIRKNAGQNIQLSGVEDAQQFISDFYSRCTGTFFSRELADSFTNILPRGVKGNYYIWNVGCGNGHETYSLTALFRNLNPEAAIKVWANDKDLLSISNAPNIAVDIKGVPPYLTEYITNGTKGGVIAQTLRDIIYFEYHDVKNHNPYPDVDLIICRDVLSFFDYNDQFRVISEFYEKLKSNGILITGDNENIHFDGLDRSEEKGLFYYRKNSGISKEKP